MTALRIGLTGPIACGKSTVAGWLVDGGAALVDADAVAREVTAPGTGGHDAVLARFGDAVRAPDGTLDRVALARIVFADPQRLAELEAIVHPLVRPALLARVETAEAEGAPVVAIEAIKLVEGGLAELCDEVWLVTCDPADQGARLLRRGMAADDAGRRLAAQAGLAERLAPLSTRVIDTSGSRAEARARVRDGLAAAVAGRRPVSGSGGPAGSPS